MDIVNEIHVFHLFSLSHRQKYDQMHVAQSKTIYCVVCVGVCVYTYNIYVYYISIDLTLYVSLSQYRLIFYSLIFY